MYWCSRLRAFFARKTPELEPPSRLFSIFTAESESELMQQCCDDLREWGFDGFQSRQKATRILENAQARVCTEIGQSSSCDAAEGQAPTAETAFDAKASQGVTIDDLEWYGSLPPLARAAMEEFDKELRDAVWLQCHSTNLCIEDLERDVGRRLPTFAHAVGHGDEDAPLPWELKRRFVIFISTIRRDQASWESWNERIRTASSMNALIREEVRAGRL
jgi:hypothetical protein